MAPSFGPAERRRLIAGAEGAIGWPRGQPLNGPRVNLTASESSRRTRRASLLCASASIAVLAGASAALAAPAAPAPKAPAVSELVVDGAPKVQPGAVVGDIKPDLQLQPEDIQSYGVSTITELLAELAPEIGSNSGRGGEGPAILVNGRRISGINEIRNLPTEAILRVDILPEEAALKYGFSANQRVVNIVLKDHVDVELADLAGGASTEGGGASGQAEGGITRINGEQRFNIDLKYDPQAALTEAQRGVTSLATGPTLDLAGNPVDQRPYRTLQAGSQMVSLNAVYTRPIFAGISATVNVTLQDTTTDAQRGLPAIDLTTPSGLDVDRLVTGLGALNQTSDAWTGHLGMSFNRDVSQWRLALTGNYDHADTINDNDTGLDATALQAAILAGTVNPAGPFPTNLLVRAAPDTSRTITDTANMQFVASGPIWTIPAGEIRTSFRLGATGSAFQSQSQRLDLSQSQTFSQDSGNAQASIDLPLTSAKNKVLPMFGDVTVNAHVAAQTVTGFGVLQTFGYGLHWAPITGLSILVNHLHDQAAPSQQQTGAALLLTPNTRIFDFATGQTVDVTEITGGNPALTKDNRDRFSARITYQPFQDKQLIFRADYNQIHYRNPITTFPAATAAIEAAFPDRFIRDGDGELTEVDYRPVNFASQDVNSLKWGFDYSRPIGPATAPPPRNQVFQQLRRAGVTGALGRRPGGAQPGPSPDGAAPPGAPGAPGAAPDGPSLPPVGGPPLGAFAGPGGPGGGGPGGGGGGGPGGGGGFAGGRGGPGGRGGGGAQDGRLRISVFHTVYFADRFLARPGGPLIDFLDGASLGGAGGQPQQEVQAQINIAERGYGAELNADWKSGTSVKGAAGSTGDLDFSGLIKINARVFADLTQRKTLVEQQPWLKGVRVSFSVANIFDQRISVHDMTGATPINFQPAYLDPLGRTWRIELRKLFS
jgi:iron complex outermembrane recepter protein